MPSSAVIEISNETKMAIEINPDEVIGSVYLGLNNLSNIISYGYTKEGVYMNVSTIIVVGQIMFYRFEPFIA